MGCGIAMIRVIITGFLSFIFVAILQSCEVFMPAIFSMVFLPPILLVFSVRYFTLKETLGVGVLVGGIIDGISGYLIGSSMVIFLLFTMVLSLSQILSGRIHRFDLPYYVFFVSLSYRIVFIIVEVVFFSGSVNIDLWQIILGPIFDAFASLAIFYVLATVLAQVKAFDSQEYFKNGLGRRR